MALFFAMLCCDVYFELPAAAKIDLACGKQREAIQSTVVAVRVAGDGLES